MKYAPIALFVYKRPAHTRQTLEALMQCPEFSGSQLFVFCDGPRNPDDQAPVQETRMLVKSLVGDHACVIESLHNQGLANSIIAGVTNLVNEFGRAIVLEDDLLVSPVFLSYVNQALDLYQDQELVMQVSGYMFPTAKFANQNDAMFLPLTVSWGWATWQRAWQYFEPNISGHEALNTYDVCRRFNLDGYFDNKGLLDLQMLGQIDSWAIRWYWSFFKKAGLTLFPPISYVKDIGRDGSGTHSSRVGNLIFKKLEHQSVSTSLLNYPQNVNVNQDSYRVLKKSLLFYSIRNSIGIARRKIQLASLKRRQL